MKRLHHAGIALAVIAAVAASFCAGCGREKADEGDGVGHAAGTPVVVTTAMRGTIEDTLELTGTAQANDEVDVVPEGGGKVTRIPQLPAWHSGAVGSYGEALRTELLMGQKSHQSAVDTAGECHQHRLRCGDGAAQPLVLFAQRRDQLFGMD